VFEWDKFKNTDGDIVMMNWDEANRDLLAILKTKTSGTAKRKVDSVDRGEGVRAYYVLCKWFQGATGVSIQDLRSKLMSPYMAKKESEILGRIETWKKDLMDLHNLELAIGCKDEESMNERMKVTAIKNILCGHTKQYMMQREEDFLLGNDEEDIPYDRYMTIVVRHLTRRAFEDEDDKGINEIGFGMDQNQ
jgi:hypothetical protein